MSPNDTIAALVREALRLPPASRDAFIDGACPDPETRTRVLRLIAQQESATIVGDHGSDALFESASADEAQYAAPEHRPATNGAARRLGKYAILDILGEGGMGVVYLAEQDRPRRTIALKVIRPGLLTPRLLRRFEHESQILARLQHHGIAQIFEAGAADTGAGPQPFFAMEYIKGLPLTEFARSNSLDTRERLALFMKVCDAVQHAHQKGVIHRDLKPSNILVDASGQPKVLDFGVARAADDEAGSATLHTEAGIVVGTLPYMSPEQLEGRAEAIDTRADVYALGVILYELLAGRLPLPVNGKTLPEVVRIVTTGQPTPLGVVRRDLKGDLATIVDKAIEKDKTRRYQSASDLEADLQRYLRNEPISARPPSTIYLTRKFAQRNRVLVGGIAASFIVLIGGVMGISWQARRATIEAEVAREVSSFLDAMLRAVSPEQAQGREPTLRELVDDAAAGLDARRSINPRVELALRDTIGHTYGTMSRLPEAERQYRRVLELCAALHGTSSRQTLSARRNIAGVLADRGNFDDAERESLAIVADAKRLLGENDPDTAFAMMELGRIYQETGRWDQAKPLLEHAVRIGRDQLGEGDQRFITALHNLGTALKDSGQAADAIALLREALRLREKTLGPNHPDTLYSMNNLAAALHKSNNDAERQEAEKLLRTTLEARTRVLGPDHIATITTTANLAVSLVEAKRLEEALPLAERAYEGWKKSLGETHPKTLIGQGNLAYLYEDLGRLDEAEKMYRAVISLRRGASGGQDPETWSPMNNLAMLLVKRDRAGEAEPVYRELLQLCRAALPADHPYVGIFRNNFGECLTRTGKLPEAETELTESQAVLEARFGAAHARTLKGVERLVALYETMGNREKVSLYRARLP